VGDHGRPFFVVPPVLRLLLLVPYDFGFSIAMNCSTKVLKLMRFFFAPFPVPALLSRVVERSCSLVDERVREGRRKADGSCPFGVDRDEEGVEEEGSVEFLSRVWTR
jgi:hypothetical protein